MTDLRKAAEMALDALRLYVTMYPQMDKGYMVDARKTLRQALAQPEQEHIECGYDETVGMCTNNPCCEQAQPEQEPKLTDAGADTNISRGLEPKGSGMVTLHQREWVGLTNEEIADGQAEGEARSFRSAVRWVEAKLKEKNDAV